MKALLTRYHPAAARQGSRISVSCEGYPRRYYTYDHDAACPHRAAAALWLSTVPAWPHISGVISGQLPDGSYAHVLVARGEVGQ
jgi:hypothetical protein